MVVYDSTKLSVLQQLIMLKLAGLSKIKEFGPLQKRAFKRITNSKRRIFFIGRPRNFIGTWKKNKKVPGPEIAEEVESISAAITYEEAEEQAWGEIEDYLKSMPPYDLQKLVASLLKAMGYHVSWISPPGKDGGLDILAWNDPLGTRPPRIKVQVKREQGTTNVSTLRSFMALLGDNDVGIFVSTGGFTKDAEDEARTQQSRQVTLVNLQRLFELWVEHINKLDEEARDFLPLKPIYFLSPDD